MLDIILLFLFAGLPYYIFFEKSKKLGSKAIFFLSALLVVAGLILTALMNAETSILLVVTAFFASLYSLYRANKTTNLYKLSYYILFFNAPMLLLFESSAGVLYGLSLLLTLLGLVWMGSYYEKNYGSANYLSITGITLVTPYAGIFLTVYLTALALYPPFPNSFSFLNALLSMETNFVWYVVMIVIFFGNFIIAVKVMARTVFGKPNQHVHYIDLQTKERTMHLALLGVLLLLSLISLGEVLS